MPTALVDTNILIELYRNREDAAAWLATQANLGLSTVTWLEFMEGARGKQGQKRCLEIISSFELVLLDHIDQQWAIRNLLQFRLSHGVSFADCLIAAPCHRLQLPLFTKNVKDFAPLLGKELVQQPY